MTRTPRFAVAFVLGTLLACQSPASNRTELTAQSKTDASTNAGLGIAKADAHGFNDRIAWRTLADGLQAAVTSGRPVMLLVHASWCDRCRALEPKFHEAELERLSEKFVMVNVDQDRVPESNGYAPDGNYVPRILFFDPVTGEVDERIKNPVRERYHYYYAPNDDVVGAMRSALERHGRS